MAFEEQITETIEAGAPSIKYEGDIQQQQQIAQELWENLPPQVQAQFGSFEQFFSSGAWKKVLQMLQQQQQQGQQPQQMAQGPQQMAPGPQQPQEGIGSMMPAQMAYGGIAGPDGRRAYGIGSWFQKKIMDPIKKNIVPLGIGAASLYGLSKLGGTGGISGGLGKIFKGGGTLANIMKDPKWMIPAASLVAGAFAKPQEQLGGGAMSRGAGINLQDISKLANITDEQQGQAIGLNFLPEASARKYSPEEMALTYSQAGKAHGGRIGAEEGGLMSLGGNEMDLRGGGFVPLGEQEKADDVPARLSKNEFVFTADAVRAAGGGNVDAGADKMYNTMKQLEGRVG
jgi:hypothetical protein